MMEDEFHVHSERRGLIGVIQRHRKVLLIAALLWLSFIMGTGLTLSTMDVKRGLHVFGSESWVAGKGRVLRIALKNLERGGTLPLNSVEAHFVDAEGHQVRSDQPERAGPFIQGEVIAPRRPGTYTLMLQAEDENGGLVAQTTIEVMGKMPPQLPRPTSSRCERP